MVFSGLCCAHRSQGAGSPATAASSFTFREKLGAPRASKCPLCLFLHKTPQEGDTEPRSVLPGSVSVLQGWFGAGFLCPRGAGQGLSPRGGLLVLQEHNVSSFLCSLPGDLTIKLSGQGVEAWWCFSHVSCLSFPCWPLFGSALEHLGGIRRARHLLLVPTRGSRPFTPVAQGAARSKRNSRRGSVPSPAANAAHGVQP